MTTGMDTRSARSARSTSKPSMPGRPMSRIIRSKSPLAAAARAARPSPTTAVAKPLARSPFSTKAAMRASSSAMSTRLTTDLLGFRWAAGRLRRQAAQALLTEHVAGLAEPILVVEDGTAPDGAVGVEVDEDGHARCLLLPNPRGGDPPGHQIGRASCRGRD